MCASLQPRVCRAAAPRAQAAPLCVMPCRDQEEWSFSCVCGRNEGATARAFEAPSGRMFECHSRTALSLRPYGAEAAAL